MRATPCALLVAACAVLSVSADAAAQTPPMRPGMWQISVAMEMPNLPTALPPITTNQCVTPEMVESRDGLFQGGPLGGPMQAPADETDCAMEQYDIDGRTMTWTMVCTQPQALTVEGEMTFADDRYFGTARSTTPQGVMTMDVDAQRVGDCE